MVRGPSKKPRQAEKLLLVLLDGREVQMAEVQTTLGGVIEVYRLSTYLWCLKMMGAEITKFKKNRKIVAIQLTNTDAMVEYARSRGLIAGPAVVLTPEDLMVASV